MSLRRLFWCTNDCPYFYVLLRYRTVKRLLIPILQIRVRNGKLVLLFLNQNICCGYLNGPIKSDGSFEDQKHAL